MLLNPRFGTFWFHDSFIKPNTANRPTVLLLHSFQLNNFHCLSELPLKWESDSARFLSRWAGRGNDSLKSDELTP